MTVRLQFPPQVAAAPPPWQPADDARVTREEAAAEARRHREAAAADRRALVTTMLLGAGVFGVMAGGVGRYGLWYARGRDPEAAAVAEFLPEPPDDLGPGAAGALVDEIVHQRDIVATLADLAWKGVLGLRDGTGPSRDDPKVTNLRHDATIRGFERALVETLLVENPGLGATVRLSAVSSRFARAAPRVRGLLDVELVERGYFPGSPEETRQAWRDRALKAFLVLLIGGRARGPSLRETSRGPGSRWAWWRCSPSRSTS